MSDRCPLCKEFVFKFIPHRCPPVWYVHLLEIDEEGEAKKVYALDAREAAEKRVAQYDSYDYDLIREDEETKVIVWDKNMENPTLYEVEARMEPAYYASSNRRDPLPDWATNGDEIVIP